ncbi:LapA family protein [Limnobacter humi]|uniref:LapA family protein n=1 Tax=Limnobacter humi TaxID=1778671 RepID=A0ABT1WGD8_9BURK|nr:LapA family protein [Limnobacter humi]MCQ8896583.1 LapA family protein [Limnobacter humi]
MKAIAWVVRIALFLVVLTFSIRNTDVVIVKWLPGLEIQVQLVVALLTAFLCGAAFAWVSLLPSWFRAKRAASSATKALERVEREQSRPNRPNSGGVSGAADEAVVLPVGPTHGI